MQMRPINPSVAPTTAMTKMERACENDLTAGRIKSTQTPLKIITPPAFPACIKLKNFAVPALVQSQVVMALALKPTKKMIMSRSSRVGGSSLCQSIQHQRATSFRRTWRASEGVRA